MNIGVIFAGGSGKRMHSISKPKQFLEIQGKPIIVHTLDHFENNSLIDAVVVVCIEEWIPYLTSIIERFGLQKIKSIVPGGSSGQLSIYNGLVAAESLCKGDDSSIVLIHDGVRPLINSELLTANIEDVKKYGSSITVSAAVETILKVDGTQEIAFLPERSESRIAKAPQCFYLKEILAAHRDALARGKIDYIDSCSMMYTYGKKLHITEGPSENIKVTTQIDYYTLRAILQAKEDRQLYFDE